MQNSQRSVSPKFAAAYKLLRADGFDHVIRARNVADNHFKVYFSNNCRNNARLGIIASKKILPRATDRNRIKRIIRETFRQHDIKYCGLDLVVMLKRKLAKQDVQARSLSILLNLIREDAHNCN